MARQTLRTRTTLVSPASDIKTAVEAFRSYCKAKNLSENTIIYYGYRLRSYVKYLHSCNINAAPIDATPQTIRGFIAYETHANSAATAHHSIITLRAFFNYLVTDGFLESSPMDKVSQVRCKRTIIETFTTEQLEAVLKTCENDFVGVRDRAMILVLLDSGLRASELCGLKDDDICWEDQTFSVIGKGAKERLVPFGNTTRQALTKYISWRGELETKNVFVTCYAEPVTRFHLREVVLRRCKKADITGVRCSPHTFRHTFAVSYLRAGGDVFSLQKILGHSDITMTRRYAELSQTDVQEKHRQFSPADRLPKERNQTHKKLFR